MVSAWSVSVIGDTVGLVSMASFHALFWYSIVGPLTPRMQGHLSNIILTSYAPEKQGI